MDGSIVGRRYGNGRAFIVALHGWGRDSGDWSRVLDGFDAVAIDLPGFGLSPPPPSPWGTREYGKCVLEEVINRLAAPTIVVGHSFGGRVAVQLADLAPERIKAVVLSGVPFFRDPEQRRKPALRYRGARLAWRRGLISERRFERYRSRFGSPDYRHARGVMRDILVRTVNESYEDELMRLRVPIVLLWGSHDTAAPVELAVRAAKKTGARLEVTEGAGHFLPTEGHEAFRSVLRELTS